MRVAIRESGIEMKTKSTLFPVCIVHSHLGSCRLSTAALSVGKSENQQQASALILGQQIIRARLQYTHKTLSQAVWTIRIIVISFFPSLSLFCPLLLLIQSSIDMHVYDASL